VIELSVEDKDYRGIGKRKTRPELRLVAAAAAVGNGANRESKPKVVLSQEVGSTTVESQGGSDKTGSSAYLDHSNVPREVADHKEEVGQVEEEEEENRDDVDR
jgi:hypothetical protein